MPISSKHHKRAPKDIYAKWTKKHGKIHFGYKLQASIDKCHKFVRKVNLINAAVSDSVVFENLLNPNNTNRDVYADRVYPGVKRKATLAAIGWQVQIQRNGSAINPISETQRQRNRRIFTPRASVEHVFGAMLHIGGKVVRCVGIVRTTFALHLRTAIYNLQRLVFLKERDNEALSLERRNVVTRFGKLSTSCQRCCCLNKFIEPEKNGRKPR